MSNITQNEYGIAHELSEDETYPVVPLMLWGKHDDNMVFICPKCEKSTKLRWKHALYDRYEMYLEFACEKCGQYSELSI